MTKEKELVEATLTRRQNMTPLATAFQPAARTERSKLGLGLECRVRVRVRA